MDQIVRWLEAEDQTVLAIGWRRYVARPISARIVLQALMGYAAADPPEQRARFRRLFRLAFPWRLSYRWRGDPVRMIEDLPATDYQGLVRDFFAWANPTAKSRRSRSSATPSPSNSSASAPGSTLAVSPSS